MNYSEVLQALENASLFDVYRLKIAINFLLDQLERLFAIKRQLSIGMNISYFCNRENKLIDAVIEEIRRNNACVRNKDDGKPWIIPFYFINLQNTNTDIHIKSAHKKIDRNQLQVGENISFTGRDDQEEMYGTIVQLNQKTVSVLTRNGERWRVGYGLLSKTLDADDYETFDTKMIDVHTDDKNVMIIDV